MASPTYSPTYSDSDSDELDAGQVDRASARHEAGRDDERDHDGNRERCRACVPGLTLERMVNKLNERGPLDVLMHVLVAEGSVCPFSTNGVTTLRRLHGAMEAAGLSVHVQNQPLEGLLSRLKPCRGHAMGFTLAHLRAHAGALAGPHGAPRADLITGGAEEDGEGPQPEPNALLHYELVKYLERRGVSAADVRREKELEKELAALQAAQCQLEAKATEAFEEGFAKGLEEGRRAEPSSLGEVPIPS